MQKAAFLIGGSFVVTNAPNTTKAEFANTVDPDEMTHNKLSHLDLKCLPSSLNTIHVKFILKVLTLFCCLLFLALYEINFFPGHFLFPFCENSII